METIDQRLPVTLLTGALGSGKTTLLNRILQENHGIKFGVIVNEFGELSIDHHLVVGTDEQVVELASGCVCCTVREDLLDAITRILQRPSGIQYLVVETTGLADPRPVAQTFLHEELCDDVRLDAILTVLDAANFHDNLLRSGTTIDQILAGDILLLNKVDLVSDAMRQEIKEEIGDLNPAARLLETVNGEVDIRLLLDVDLHRPAATAGDGMTPESDDVNRGERTSEGDGVNREVSASEGDGTNHEVSASDDVSDSGMVGDFVSLAKLTASAKTAGSHLDREEIASVSFTSTYPFDYERLGAFLEALPRNIFRGKGLLWIEGYEEQLLFHLVGDRSTAVLHTPWPEGPRESKLVLIGQRLDRDELLALLDACLLKN